MCRIFFCKTLFNFLPQTILKTKETLINSGTARLRGEIVQRKTRIAANSQSIGKIRNAAMGNFNRKNAFHELISGSLGCNKVHGRGIIPYARERVISFLQTVLLDNLCNHTRTHGTTTFTNREAQAFFHGDGADQFYFHVDVVARHDHFGAFR